MKKSSNFISYLSLRFTEHYSYFTSFWKRKHCAKLLAAHFFLDDDVLFEGLQLHFAADATIHIECYNALSEINNRHYTEIISTISTHPIDRLQLQPALTVADILIEQ